MSGHSKWNNIKQRKGKQDAIRGKIFTKLAREITIAAKQGGTDPDMNATLRDAIAKAKANNMPNSNIDNAIKKAAGKDNEDNLEAITYEGYAPHGVAVIVKCLTDNKNRTAGDVRHVFSKRNGNLGTPGCVSYMFNSKGVFVVEKEGLAYSEDELMMLTLDAGSEDMVSYDEVYEIITDPQDFSSVAKVLEDKGIKTLEAGIQMLPTNYISLDAKSYESIERIVEALEDLDDVQEVFHNAEEA